MSSWGRLFETAGNLLHRYLEKPRLLRPLGSGETFVPGQDTRGGTEANFIVEWVGERPITGSLIEAVMMGISGSQGFSFTSRGQTIPTRHLDERNRSPVNNDEAAN